MSVDQSIQRHDERSDLGDGFASAVSIYEQTLNQIDRMTAETPRAIGRWGTLRVAESAAETEDCARQLEAMRRDGLPVEAYTGSEGTGLLFPAETESSVLSTQS